MIHFFLHIPQSAGTSLREAIAANYSEEQLLRVYGGELNFWPPNVAFIQEISRRIGVLRAVFGHYSFGAHHLAGLNDVVYSTVLREPAARIRSFYLHQQREHGSRLHSLIHAGMSLKTLVEARMAPEFNNFAVRVLSTDASLVRAVLGPHGVTPGNAANCNYLRSGLGFADGLLHGDAGPYDQLFHRSHLVRALDNIQNHFCFVGIAERLAESSKGLYDGLGWTFRQSDIQHLNPAPEGSWKMDSATLDAIHEYNALDYELYERFSDLSFRNFSR
jgi:hypothetical protein